MSAAQQSGYFFRASLVVQTISNLPAVQENHVRTLGQEDPLEKGVATDSSVLAWRIAWTADPGRLQSMGLQRVRHDWQADTLQSLIPLHKTLHLIQCKSQSSSMTEPGLLGTCSQGLF